MTEEKLDILRAVLKKRGAAVEAPAGHGKTEMIADLVELSDGDKVMLLLTHTNAGADALAARMRKRGIPRGKYRVHTIAGFCMRWCESYRRVSGVDGSLSPFAEDPACYYDQVYAGAVRIFSCSWARDVLRAAYAGVIVDEYQDCTLSHQDLFVKLNEVLPVYVFGDPMQAIFTFGRERLVDWTDLPFEKVSVPTSPERWRTAGNGALGDYLEKTRADLAGLLDVKGHGYSIAESDSVRLIRPNDHGFYLPRSEIGSFSSVVYITKWGGSQLHFSERRQSGLTFQFEETRECPKLIEDAGRFDGADGATLASAVVAFAADCATGVNTKLKRFADKLGEGTLKPAGEGKGGMYEGFKRIVLSAPDADRRDFVVSALEWIRDFRGGDGKRAFTVYRRELFSEMIRSARLARSRDMTMKEAAQLLRADPSYRRNYRARYLSSRVVLSKGLEFDCAIVDMGTGSFAKRGGLYTIKEFYVAMTRARKMIYIITPSKDISFAD